jgi:hypothetical protein
MEYQDRIDLLTSEGTRTKFPFIQISNPSQERNYQIPRLTHEQEKEIDYAISLVGKLHAF